MKKTNNKPVAHLCGWTSTFFLFSFFPFFFTLLIYSISPVRRMLYKGGGIYRGLTPPPWIGERSMVSTGSKLVPSKKKWIKPPPSVDISWVIAPAGIFFLFDLFPFSFTQFFIFHFSPFHSINVIIGIMRYLVLLQEASLINFLDSTRQNKNVICLSIYLPIYGSTGWKQLISQVFRDVYSLYISCINIFYYFFLFWMFCLFHSS